jgi:hypothetical protein
MNNILIFLVTFVCSMLVIRCSPTRLAGGSDNPDFRVSGSLVDSLGNPVIGAQVKLIPGGYIPASDKIRPGLALDTTDESGSYSLKASQKGYYNMVAVDYSHRTRGMVQGIIVQDAITRVALATLKAPGSIRVILPQFVDSIPVNVFIPGTDISVFVNLAARYAFLDSLPAGIMPSVCYTETSNPTALSTLAENVVVLPGVSTLAGKAGWNFSRILFLNTTSGGAGTTGNVYSFPVLVRLTKGNFNFNEAKTDGSDIRFVTSGNMRLSYEIEQWDASQGSAAIWVKVDTVLGNNGTQYITMQWGNPDGQNMSSGESVFDTSSGFQGVWHMNETGAGSATDATPNHYDGTPSTPPPVGAPGLIGACRKFNGTSNFIMMNGTANSRLNFPVNGNYTVSAWVNLDSILGVYKVFISKGYVQYTLQINSRKGFDFSEFHDNLGWQYSAAPASAQVWKHVVGVREGTKQYLYIDGILATSTIILDTSTTPRFTGDQLIMGAASGGTRDFLNGMMDELSISSVSRGSDWIKLCYMNQRVDDQLILYK